MAASDRVIKCTCLFKVCADEGEYWMVFVYKDFRDDLRPDYSALVDFWMIDLGSALPPTGLAESRLRTRLG